MGEIGKEMVQQGTKRFMGINIFLAAVWTINFFHLSTTIQTIFFFS